MPSGICEPTVDDVRTLITTGLTDAAIQALIDDAALLAFDCIQNLTCDRQTAILKWVTAHLIASLSSSTAGNTGIKTAESLGDASVSYAKPVLGTTGLKSTTYGMQAIALDPNGCLAGLGMSKTYFEVLGTVRTRLEGGGV